MVLSVGEHHQHLVVLLSAFLDGRARGLDCFRNRCSTLRQQGGIENVQVLAKRIFIHGHRHLKESRTGESHQSNPIRSRKTTEVERSELCFGQPIGGDILRQHAARGVDRNDNVQSPLFDLLIAKSPLGSAQSEQGGSHRDRDQPQA